MIIIYTIDTHASAIAQLIMKVADVGAENEGLIAITPVEELYWIKEKKLASEVEFNYLEVGHD